MCSLVNFTKRKYEKQSDSKNSGTVILWNASNGNCSGSCGQTYDGETTKEKVANTPAKSPWQIKASYKCDTTNYVA